jgi:hypothetical protein
MQIQGLKALFSGPGGLESASGAGTDFLERRPVNRMGVARFVLTPFGPSAMVAVLNA